MSSVQRVVNRNNTCLLQWAKFVVSLLLCLACFFLRRAKCLHFVVKTENRARSSHCSCFYRPAGQQTINPVCKDARDTREEQDDVFYSHIINYLYATFHGKWTDRRHAEISRSQRPPTLEKQMKKKEKKFALFRILELHEPVHTFNFVKREIRDSLEILYRKMAKKTWSKKKTYGIFWCIFSHVVSKRRQGLPVNIYKTTPFSIPSLNMKSVSPVARTTRPTRLCCQRGWIAGTRRALCRVSRRK